MAGQADEALMYFDILLLTARLRAQDVNIIYRIWVKLSEAQKAQPLLPPPPRKKEAGCPSIRSINLKSGKSAVSTGCHFMYTSIKRRLFSEIQWLFSEIGMCSEITRHKHRGSATLKVIYIYIKWSSQNSFFCRNLLHRNENCVKGHRIEKFHSAFCLVE